MCRTRFLILFAAAAAFAQQSDTPAYTWSATGPLQIARQGACAAALPDGRILVAGGQDATGALKSVEIYQRDGSFAPGREMLGARSGHTCTALSDGRVLAAGGAGGVPAETYDSVTNSWNAAELGTARWNHTATLLPDGRVLLAGGETADGASDLLEWFDPQTNRIRPLPAGLSAPRTLHGAAALADGSVLVAGGWDGQSLLDAVDIVKLDGTVQKAAALPAARAGHTATTLNTGCVLIAGGLGVEGDLKSATVFCPDSGAFQSVGDMSVARFGHLAVGLPDNGKILIAGGFSQGEASPVSELFDPETNAFVAAGSLTLARLGIAAAAISSSGAVLAVGGYTADGPVAACGILKNPTVVFDKTRYLDGDAVTVTGLTWTPGEKVSLKVTTQSFAKPGQLAQISTQNFQAVASALGRIQLTLFTAAASNAGATYTVNATGATSGLTAANSARQISRTTTTLTVSPFPALTRQPVLLQAIVTPAATLDLMDGNVTFLLGSSTLGTVSSAGQFTNVSRTGNITDGTSNTIQAGETLPPTSTGSGITVMLGDGSVRTVSPGSAFQLITKDIPAGDSTTLSVTGPPGSATASYAAFTSLYAPSSASAGVSVQKRTVNVAVTREASSRAGGPIVGDPVPVNILVTPPQLPLADVTPTGTAHLTIAPGIVLNAPLSPSGLSGGSRALFTLTLPAGTRSFSAQYDGDPVYLAGSVLNTAPVTIGKGTVGFSLIPGKTTFTVGEPITMLGRILHPKVPGATPTGQITRTSGPTQFQTATVSADPQNTGLIDTNIPVSGFPGAGNYALTMTYSGDANFLPVSAGTILTIAKAVPQITVIPPAQVTAGQQASFTVRISAPSGLLSSFAVTGQVSLTGIANGASANLVAGTSSTAIIRQTFPAAGTFTVSVQYGGDANYLATTSTPITVVVQ